MNCQQCNNDRTIVNKHFKLCLECNNLRLYGSKFGKQYKLPQKMKSPLKPNINPLKAKINRITHIVGGRAIGKTSKIKIWEDEQFYQQCFDLSDHKCEECGKNLPTEFRGEDGKVNARWRYSHVIPKSIAPELRHNINNINHLCINDHQKWENGNKKSMKIYKNNRKAFPNFFKD